MKILGITNCVSWNSAACLLIDGVLISINEEERFIRKKHALEEGHSAFPLNAINECLKHGKISVSDVDLICIGWGENVICGNSSEDNIKFVKQYTDKTLNGLKSMGFDLGKVKKYNHHLCHAASSFFCSNHGFSNIISLDGAGDDCSGWIGFSEGAFSDLRNINAHASNHFSQVISCGNSWGNLWENVTEILGFKRHSGEGKTMGLAPYGEFDPNILPSFFASNGAPEIYKYNCFFADKGWIYGRGKQLEPLSQEGKNLAHTLQKYYNDFLVQKAQEMIESNSCKNFCITGGVGLNCTGNGYLANSGLLENIFIQPASSDSGTSLGAAILGGLEYGSYFQSNFNHAYWGSSYSLQEIKEALSRSSLKFEEVDNVGEAVAELLHKDQVVCNFQGRAEIGPRALGNRSVLANPCKKENLDRINKIKGRESWRPLAPSILEEDYFNVVDTKHHSPYMLMACQVSEEYKEKIPAVVHVDGSCRPQTVFKSTNEIYHNIILEFKKRTGIPVVLNTSFNMYYEPIVNSPDDAIKSFTELGADSLCIGNFIATK
tara:strand:- start:4687 stop:6327 length:1641 start_codon:yes stop_codon:yes gene_type:complete